jgi:hypothetical protein
MRKPALYSRLLLPSVEALRGAAHHRLLWAYQFVAELNFVRESWTALVDVERVRPTQDANEVAARQIEALLSRFEEGEAVVPLFVFDAGYDPVKVQRALQESPC